MGLFITFSESYCGQTFLDTCLGFVGSADGQGSSDKALVCVCNLRGAHTCFCGCCVLGVSRAT